MKKTAYVLVFLLVAVAVLWKPLLLGKALLPGQYLQQMLPWSDQKAHEDAGMQWNPLAWDAVAQFYPWRVFLGRSLSQGVIPLWNPHQFCGSPFLANGQSAVLYPPNWVFAFVDPARAFTYLAVFHLFLAGLFAFLMLRDMDVSGLAAVFGGVSFELCAFMMLWLELPTLVSTAAWMPGVLWAVNRAVRRASGLYGALGAAMLALAVLAGHLQIAMYVWLLAAAWMVFVAVWVCKDQHAGARKTLALCAFIITAGGMLAGAQILPSLELQRLSHRHSTATMDGYRQFAANGLPVHRLVTALMPDYFGNPNRGNYLLLGQAGNRFNMPADFMEFGLYAGTGAVALAFVGVLCWKQTRYARFWIITALASMLLALGTWINLPFYFLIPGFSSLGGPHRILVIYLLALCVLAAFGIDKLSQQTSKRLHIFGLQIPYTALFGAAGIVFMCLAGVITMAPADGVTSQLAEGLSGALGAVQAGSVTRYAIFAGLSALVILLGSAKAMPGKWMGGLLVGLAVVDLVGYGWSVIPTCPRSQVYGRTHLTNYLTEHKDRRVMPVNRTWSLTSVPQSILPPNAAMVYGYYDVQGYDSLYTAEYKKYLQRSFGADPCPPENGNMILNRAEKGSDLGLRVFRTSDQSARRVLAEFGSTGISDAGIEGCGWIARAGAVEVPVEFPDADSIDVQVPESAAANVCVRVLDYPGWIDKSSGKNVERDGIWMKLPAEQGRALKLVFQPESFEVGLFVSLLGLAVCCGAVTHACRGKSGK